ncbi:g-protein coupled receptor [Trichonephila clavata]|uniref:G-protein coupled receptor n=1 Tax=Trichonephila clavata TaxID=2740835 RepID=A0A8X6HJN2_TRICU|nr:g-protein coupled receptor [Trichonephila clavata]
MGAVWIVAILLSALPLLDIDYYGDEFYGNNGVCLPIQIHDPFGPTLEDNRYHFNRFDGDQLPAFVSESLQDGSEDEKIADDDNEGLGVLNFSVLWSQLGRFPFHLVCVHLNVLHHLQFQYWPEVYSTVAGQNYCKALRLHCFYGILVLGAHSLHQSHRHGR